MPSNTKSDLSSSPDADALDEGRERILAAATDVFGLVGFQKATIQDIVSEAGVSRPLFYRRFNDKTQVFEVFVDRLITQWNETLVSEVTAAPGGAAGELRVLHDASLAYGRARPLFHRLLTRDTQLLLSNETDVIERGSRALRQLIEDILHRGIERGEIRRDVAATHIADLLTAIHLAYSDRVVIEDAPLDPDLSEGIIACMLSGVMATEE